MGRIVSMLAVIALLFSAGYALADDNSEANRLLVEAVKLVNAAGNEASAVGRLNVLEEALSKLYEIIEKHPSSDLAAKLTNEQDMGKVSLEQVSDAAVRARILYYEGGNILENYAEQFVRIFNALKEAKAD